MAGGEGGRELEPHLVHALSLPSMAPLTAVAYCLDAVVPRKARSCLPRAVPMAWWSYRAPILPPAAENSAEETRKTCSPQRVCVAPVSDLAAPATSKKPPKKARRCLNCDAVDTPQWRSGPMGKSTLCNACGVRYRAVGTLLDHRPATRTMAEPWPETPESPHSPIWKTEHKSANIYLVRKPAKLGRPPKQEPASPAPAPPRKTKLRKKKRMKSCVHCGSSETPQWREGPMGRGTLCNACGVRYRQGRLLPEYRPKGSPTFSASEHASNHRRVLQLRRQQRENNQSPPPPPTVDSATAKPIVDEQLIDPQQEQPIDLPQEQPIDEPVAAAGDMSNSLDALLLDGPSPPLIEDGDDFLIS
ncbi:hypothetical protein ABZP36_033446 [Zizania latifolia]